MTLPNDNEPVLDINCELFTATPVPDRVTACIELSALLPMTRLSDAAPTEVGENANVNCADWPAGIVVGSVG